MWVTCMMFYLQRQDLWEVVGGSETMPPEEDSNGALRKQRIKADKSMFALKTTIEKRCQSTFGMTRHQKMHETHS